MPQHQTGQHPSPQPLSSNQGKSPLPVIFWALLGITTVIHLIYALKLPLTGDEAYFWEWGRHPALGYYDHPPMAGWILWLTRQFLGDTLAAIRLPAVLTGALVVIVIHRYALDLTGSRRSAAMTGLLAMGIPVIGVLGVLYSTDTPLLAAGTLGGYFFHRAVNRGQERAWIWTGLCFAAVLASKFLGVPLLAAAALYLLLAPEARGHLKTSGPYVAAAISLLGAVPVILWNASNNWATFAFNFASRHSGISFSFKGLADYLAGQALGLSPVVFALAVPILAAAVPVWRQNGKRARKLAAFLALVPLGGFLLLSPLTRVGLHWPAAAVPFLAVALGSSLTAGSSTSRSYLVTTVTAWTLTTLLFLLPVAPYMVPTDWAYPLRPGKINAGQLRKIMGSPTESARIVSEVLQEMSREGEVFVFTRSYALSSLLAFYTPGHPGVTVLGKGSVHGRNHSEWFDPHQHKGMNALFVTYRKPAAEAAFIQERFDRSETVLEADGPEGSLVSVVKCYGYKGIQ